MCESAWRIVIAAFLPVNTGRYFEIGSSSWSFPSSTSVITVADVSHLLADAIGITVVRENLRNIFRSSTPPCAVPISSAPPVRPSSFTRSRIALIDLREVAAACGVPASPFANAGVVEITSTPEDDRQESAHQTMRRSVAQRVSS